jgi:hypothetical protein
MARYRILYWQAIPSLVKATGEDGSELARQLPDAFQQRIDEEAMRQGLAGSDEYLAQWRWEQGERPGSASEVLDLLVAELQSGFSRP